MAAKGASRDVGRALNVPYAEVDASAKQVPKSLHITRQSARALSEPLRGMYESNPTVQKIIDTAKGLEGMPRHASTHAAGVVITRNPVYTYVPLAKNDEAGVTQYTMTTLEELGLLKMDFLGLRNLTILDDAVKMVRQHEPCFRLDQITENDPEVFQMLSDGRTSGVFQMESAGMTGVWFSVMCAFIMSVPFFSRGWVKRRLSCTILYRCRCRPSHDRSCRGNSGCAGRRG